MAIKIRKRMSGGQRLSLFLGSLFFGFFAYAIYSGNPSGDDHLWGIGSVVLALGCLIGAIQGYDEI